jgi:hypothetical protein
MSKQSDLTLGNSISPYYDKTPDDQNLPDIEPGGWHAIVARMKLDRKRPIEGADPVDEVSISINDDEYKARMK